MGRAHGRRAHELEGQSLARPPARINRSAALGQPSVVPRNCGKSEPPAHAPISRGRSSGFLPQIQDSADSGNHSLWSSQQSDPSAALGQPSVVPRICGKSQPPVALAESRRRSSGLLPQIQDSADSGNHSLRSSQQSDPSAALGQPSVVPRICGKSEPPAHAPISRGRSSGFLPQIQDSADSGNHSLRCQPSVAPRICGKSQPLAPAPSARGRSSGLLTQIQDSADSEENCTESSSGAS